MPWRRRPILMHDVGDAQTRARGSYPSGSSGANQAFCSRILTKSGLAPWTLNPTVRGMEPCRLIPGRDDEAADNDVSQRRRGLLSVCFFVCLRTVSVSRKSKRDKRQRSFEGPLLT